MKTMVEVAEWIGAAEGDGLLLEDPADAICQIFVRPKERSAKGDLFYVSKGAVTELHLGIRFTVPITLSTERGQQSGVCTYCGCTDMNACRPPCSWINDFCTVCSSPSCVKESEETPPLYKADKIELGLWVMTPSLYVPGLIHAFVSFYDVPAIAPWERLVVLAGEVA